MNFWQNSTPIRDKTFNKLEIKGRFFHQIKSIVNNLIINMYIILIGEKLNVFPPRSGTNQGCLLSPFLLDIVLKVLVKEIKKEKEKKKVR